MAGLFLFSPRRGKLNVALAFCLDNSHRHRGDENVVVIISLWWYRLESLENAETLDERKSVWYLDHLAVFDLDSSCAEINTDGGL